MSSSNVLNGVKFKLSDYLRAHKVVKLPSDFDLKDPEVLLEDLEYNFSFEHLLSDGRSSQKKKIHKHEDKRQLKKQNHVGDVNIASSHTSSRPRPQPRVKHPYPTYKSEVVSVKGKSRKHDAVSSSNKSEVLNDLTDLLTKDVVYTQDPLPSSSSQQNRTYSKHLSPTHVGHPKPVPNSICKSKVLDQFTDMLTNDVAYTRDSPPSTLKKKKSKDLYSEYSANAGLNSSMISGRTMEEENMEIERPRVERTTPFSSNTENSSSWATHVVLNELTSAERSFIQSIMSMGFQEYEVIRAMQNYGGDQNEVLRHLYKVRSLQQKGYTTESIEDALEFFHGNEEEGEKYLVLERQFSAMGFSGDKVKEALLLHDRDEAKVYTELMLT